MQTTTDTGATITLSDFIAAMRKQKSDREERQRREREARDHERAREAMEQLANYLRQNMSAELYQFLQPVYRYTWTGDDTGRYPDLVAEAVLSLDDMADVAQGDWYITWQAGYRLHGPRDFHTDVSCIDGLLDEYLLIALDEYPAWLEQQEQEQRQQAAQAEQPLPGDFDSDEIPF